MPDLLAKVLSGRAHLPVRQLTKQQELGLLIFEAMTGNRRPSVLVPQTTRSEYVSPPVVIHPDDIESLTKAMRQ